VDGVHETDGVCTLGAEVVAGERQLGREPAADDAG
jgi:hypothetical protein